jgi:hypothetical protein
MRFAYPVEQVLDRWVNRAQRLAVLRPELGLSPPPLVGSPRPRKTEREMKKLRRLWRSRLRVFAELGWPPLQDKRAFAYKANCAPFGMKLARLTAQERQEDPSLIVPTRFCRQPKFCPFCWARAVEESFDRFHFALYGTVETSRQPDHKTGKKRYFAPERGDLLELQYVHFVDRFQIEDNLQPLRRTLSRWRPALARRFDPWGGLVLFTIEPEEMQYWRVTTRMLLLTSCGRAYRSELRALWEGEKPSAIHHVPYKNHGKLCLSRHTLARAVAQTWEYPWRLLDPGSDPKSVLRLLQESHGFRTHYYYGALRYSHLRVNAARTAAG